MTDIEFKMLLISWKNFVLQYQIFYPKNSVMFPDPITIDFLITHFSEEGFVKNNGGKRRRATYDLSDGKGNTNVEVKSSFDFGKCNFSKNQNNCQRIIYVCLKLNSISFYELNNADVGLINKSIDPKKGLSCSLKKYCKTKPFYKLDF
jgi:hypothetical protein